MNLIWTTDIHLNFLNQDKRENFYRGILEKNFDSLLISGDIAEAPSVNNMLTEMVRFIKKPIYFVVGNHDYYSGSVAAVREGLTQLCLEEELLHWLPMVGAKQLSSDCVIVGTDGFADARYGDYKNSNVRMNDSVYIEELSHARLCSSKELQNKMKELADKDAKQLEEDIQKAIDLYAPKKIIVLTHIPPFPEVCMYRGGYTTLDFLPFYSSKATGDVLLKAAQENPSIEFSVFAGHTHGHADVKIKENLIVRVGASEYGRPIFCELKYE